MLDLLNKQKNHDNYVTRQELQGLIDKLSKMDKLVGPKGEDASIDKEMMEEITELAKPTTGELLSLIKPLIPAPVIGKDGEKGKDGTEISAVDLMNKLKSIKGDDRLLIDNIRGGKKIIGKMIELENATGKLNNNLGYLNEYTEEMGSELRDKIKRLEIAINNSGPDTYIIGQDLIGAIFRTTLNNGTVFNTDLSSLSGISGNTIIQSTDGSVGVTPTVGGYDLSVPEDAASVTYDNTTSGLTATDVQSAIDELDGDLDTLSGTVSTLAGDITTLQGDVTTIQGDITTIEGDITTIQGDITTINGIISGLPTVVVSTDADNAIVSGTDGGAYLDIADIDLSTIDWSTVNWTNFFADIDWTLNSWTDFFTSFYSEINWTDFIDEIVANWTATNWNTFIDSFVTNVDEDDVFNFFDQIDADKGDILVNDGTNWNLLPVGTNGKILTANSTEANGIEWASPSGGVISGTGVSFPSVNETVAFGTVVDSMMFTDLQGARQQYENLPFQSVDSQIYIVYSSSSSSSLDSITINSDRSIVNINATATSGGVFATTGTASDWYYILSGTRLFAYLSTGGINAIKYIELSGNVDIDNNYSGAVATTITHPFTRIGNIHIREDGKWIVTSETSGGLFLTINICTYDGASTLTVDSSFTRTYNNGDASGFTTVDQTTGNVIMHIYDGTFEGSMFTLNSTATSLISKRVSDQQDLRRANAIVIGNRFYVDSNIDSTSGGNITKGLKVGTIINPNL